MMYWIQVAFLIGFNGLSAWALGAFGGLNDPTQFFFNITAVSALVTACKAQAEVSKK